MSKVCTIKYLACLYDPKDFPAGTYYYSDFEDVVKGKIQQSNRDAFLFFRAFVQLFFTWLKNSSEFTKLKPARRRYLCWVTGDAHMENFGVIMCKTNEGKQRVLSMNDPDDGGPGYPLGDLMRYLTSVQLAANILGIKHPKRLKAKLKSVTKAYRKGLKTGQRVKGTKSDIISFMRNCRIKRSTFDELTDGGLSVSKRFHNGDKLLPKNPRSNPKKFHYKFDIDQKDIRIQRIAKASKKMFPGYTIKDVCQFWKFGGGSGGLIQFRVLMKNDKGEYLVYDLKPEVRGAVFPLMENPKVVSKIHNGYLAISFKPTDVIKRINTSLEVERGHKACEFTDSLMVKGIVNPDQIEEKMSFIIRPRWKGTEGISIEQIAADKKLVKMEAFVLGAIHRIQLGAMANRYHKDVGKAQKALLKMTGDASQYINSCFNAVSKEIKKC